MLKRKAIDELRKWKNQSQGKTALLIEGARRVGKSTLARQFAATEYRSFVEIDFDHVDDEVKAMFRDYATDLDSLFLYLSTYFGVELFERETVFLFDEVQRFPFVRGLVKYLVADGRYDYIETGSLISIKQNVDDIVIPSEEESMRLNPLDFEEFLWAMDEEALARLLRESYENRRPLPDALHKKASRLFREYVLVGGMPHPLQVYVDKRNFSSVDREKRLILDLYRRDVARFAKGYEHKVISIFDQIPAQLSKHEKRFSITSLGKDARMRAYEEAFFWLGDAFIANLCYASNDPSVGLSLNLESSSVKCYLADTGLLTTMVLADSARTDESVYRAVLRGDIGLNEGMLMENVVAQSLVAQGRKLYFYSQSGKHHGHGRLEIDFLITEGYANAAGKPRLSPIEVKSARQYGTGSLDRLKEEYPKRVGLQYVISPNPYRREGDRCYLPLYMAHLIAS